MSYPGARGGGKSGSSRKFYQKKWFKIVGTFVLIFLLAGGVMAWKAGITLNKISGGGLFTSIVHSIPGVPDLLQGESDGRVNIALFGMRGENVDGGGTLADTIMVASVSPAKNKVAMISVPRDLYVDNPVWGYRTKINAVYAAGEENGKKEGIMQMQRVLEKVTGLPIHYGVSINFEGFKQLVDAIGGVDIALEKPFDEAVQFNEPHVCDSFFTIPTGEWENKIVKHHETINGVLTEVKRKIPKYPLCTAPAESLECGGNFKLPAGQQTLDGEQALCYVRSRATSSDFDRAKRQQVVLKLIKEKLLSAGTLTDFGKMNAIADSLGNNIRTNAQAWEMRRLYEIYLGMNDPQIHQRVLENSQEGLLYSPPETKEAGYILLPIGDNYEKIHAMAQNIFTLPEQSDIKPK